MSQVRYEPVPFADIPGWNTDDVSAALTAFCDTAKALARDSQDDKAGVVVRRLHHLSSEAAKFLRNGPDSAASRRFFEANFVPHRVRHTGTDGLLTGYYEPELSASRVSGGRFKVPLLRRPDDLVNIVGDDMRGVVGTKLTHARRTGHGLQPFPVRSEIEQGALDGQGLEYLYLEDPVEAFFLHVQGSGLVVLPDGSRVRIGYDGKNGHPYTSVGRYVAENGWMSREDVTLDRLKAWLQADPKRGLEAMWQNRSYIFFKELGPAETVRPSGVKDIPLTPGRSLAVDTAHHIIGSPVFVTAPELRHADSDRRPFQRLMVAHDVGSAITGAERGDIFFGSGLTAGEKAGITKHRGNLYVLLPRGETV